MYNSNLLDLLEGTWTGDGRGQFLGVTSFTYRETLTFTRRDEKTLAYEQRTQKLYDGQRAYLPSHWESGFLRILENGELEMTSAQIGRVEVSVGTIEALDFRFRIRFASKVITNDPRMVTTARSFELEGDTLHYEMEMQTTKVSESTPHLKIILQQIT